MNISPIKVPTPVSPDLPSTTNRQPHAATVPPVDPGAAAACDHDCGCRNAPEPVGKEQMEAIASQLQQFLRSNDRDIEFRVDADTKAQVLTVRDAVSGEVIRQFPSADALRVLKNLAAQQGTLFHAKA